MKTIFFFVNVLFLLIIISCSDSSNSKNDGEASSLDQDNILKEQDLYDSDNTTPLSENDLKIDENITDNDIPVEPNDTDYEIISGNCPASTIGQKLGKNKLLLGGSMDDENFSKASFDLRYVYLAGAVPENGPCDRCDQNCSVNGASCSNDEGCEWWGCWQYDQDPPGKYVIDFIRKVENKNAIPIITYYIWLAASGYDEGAGEVTALTNSAYLKNYLLDLRFTAKKIKEVTSKPVIIHLEPDLWGYIQQSNKNPSQVPAAISAAKIEECQGVPDNAAGFAQCLVTIVRKNAPNALIAFHASAWGAGIDVYMNTDFSFNIAEHATETASYFKLLGADKADLFFVEMSDRDAGFNQRWWDAENKNLPNFHQAQKWVETVGKQLGQTHIWWQVPYGHLGMSDQCNTYSDNRVDYFFDHPQEFANIGTLGIAFGAGAECMTTPKTDGGYFIEKSNDYYNKERPALCGNSK